MDVTELIIAQLLYLEFEDPEKPIYFYINSTGTSWYTGDAVGFETEAFAICDTISYIKPPVHTICIGQAMGTAAVILSSGTKGTKGGSSTCFYCFTSTYKRCKRPSNRYPNKS